MALTLLVYGGLCRQGLDRTSALIGAYFAASLPLVGVTAVPTKMMMAATTACAENFW